MTEYQILYEQGDIAYVKATILYAEIHNGKVYYKVKEAEEIIPQEKLVARPEPMSRDEIQMKTLEKVNEAVSELIWNSSLPK